jgi:hypothetical protein
MGLEDEFVELFGFRLVYIPVDSFLGTSRITMKSGPYVVPMLVHPSPLPMLSLIRRLPFPTHKLSEAISKYVLRRVR